jgi:hypothetical protein
VVREKEERPRESLVLARLVSMMAHQPDCHWALVAGVTDLSQTRRLEGTIPISNCPCKKRISKHIALKSARVPLSAGLEITDFSTSGTVCLRFLFRELRCHQWSPLCQSMTLTNFIKKLAGFINSEMSDERSFFPCPLILHFCASPKVPNPTPQFAQQIRDERPSAW